MKKYHLEFDVALKKHEFPGLYIALEGVDGSGKTTQLEKLTQYFQEKERVVVITREPRRDEGLLSPIIDDALTGTYSLPSESLQYLFTADRWIQFYELIIPALKQGQIVISDRSNWSTIPYGSMDTKKKFDPTQARYLLVAHGFLAPHTQFFIPDYTFYLDISVDVIKRRIQKRKGGREMYERRTVYENVIKGYHWLLENFPDALVRVDASKSVEEVNQKILATLESST